MTQAQDTLIRAAESYVAVYQTEKTKLRGKLEQAQDEERDSATALSQKQAAMDAATDESQRDQLSAELIIARTKADFKTATLKSLFDQMSVLEEILADGEATLSKMRAAFE